MRKLRYRAGENDKDRLVLDILKKEMRLSAAMIKRIKFRPDGITQNGTRVTGRQRVAPGDLIWAALSDPTPSERVAAVAGPLYILYEDADLIVLNKQAGVVVHPCPGHYDQTLGNYLAWYYQQKGEPFVLRAINRLDKGTTGVMVLAKHAHAGKLLTDMLHTCAFSRSYIGVCEGYFAAASGRMDWPLSPCTDSRIKQQVSAQGLPARTDYQVLLQKAGLSLVRFTLHSGRTHQIRVHSAYAGHALVGDFLYGRECPQRIGRPALHSEQAELCHPITGESLFFRAPLPADMRRLLRQEMGEV